MAIIELFSMDFPIWVFWLLLAGFLLLIEVLTVNLVSIWFVVGALVSALLAYNSAGFATQGIVFFVISIGLALVCWKARGRLKITDKETVKTNADRIIGKIGVVTVKINPLEAKGQIIVCGQIWSAITENDVVLEVDTQVVVEKIIGVKTLVKKIVSEPQDTLIPDNVNMSDQNV